MDKKIYHVIGQVDECEDNIFFSLKGGKNI